MGRGHWTTEHGSGPLRLAETIPVALQIAAQKLHTSTFEFFVCGSVNDIGHLSRGFQELTIISHKFFAALPQVYPFVIEILVGILSSANELVEVFPGRNAGSADAHAKP